MRTKLFFSYSNFKNNPDNDWRDLFLRYLQTMVSFRDGLWVDSASIEAGSDWDARISAAIAESKCAVLLLTNEYLKVGSFTNDHELPKLLDSPGLKLLPVLVEPCPWEQRPDLCKLEFVPWRNDRQSIKEGDVVHRVLRALSEAGNDAPTPAAQRSDVERAVMEVCEYVRKAFGVAGQITGQQGDDLFEQTKGALSDQVDLETEPIHTGDFTVVYRGTVNGQRVAIKALPTAAWRNRVEKAFQNAAVAASTLRDESFIRIHKLIDTPEVHGFVMEYIDWDTLDHVLGTYPGKRLPPLIVAQLLERIASAQHDAHEHMVQIGALSPESIYVNRDWEVRLTPIRVEGHLARALTLSTAQVVNWDVLTMLTPEIYEGRQTVTRDDLDAHDQYYLALLGLELLMGRRPVEVSSFRDLSLKAKFFEDPRSFFDTGYDGPDRWTEACPSLAYVLARMLSRSPTERLASSEEMQEEMRRITEGRLPNSLRQSLEQDVKDMINEDFTSHFYAHLVKLRPSLTFRRTNQSSMLAQTIRDLVVFRPRDRAARFLDHVEKHKDLGLTVEDIEAFRTAFVAEVIATLEPRLSSGSARSRADAWNAVLKLGLAEMAKSLAPIAKSAGA